jgi:RNA polymerase sigma-70 factor (ECF subfamily)
LLVRPAKTEGVQEDARQPGLAHAEAELVAEIANGNIEGPMKELYGRYAASVFRLGVHVLRDQGLAEEVVQHTFERLWRNAGRFDAARGTVGAYLMVIARSVAYDIAKRPSSRPLLPLDDNMLSAQGDSTDEILDTMILQQALDALPDAQRTVLRLSLEGFTQSQIAERLGLPLGTVKTRTFHGMKGLRSVLAKRGVYAS